MKLPCKSCGTPTYGPEQICGQCFREDATSAPPSCDIAPEGWWCSRAAGHDGPCAAWPDGSGPQIEREKETDS